MTCKLAVPAICGCILASVMLAGCSEHIGKGWDWNRMRVQEKYQPYRQSAFFPDGKTMQLPPQGTVSREAGALLAPREPLVVTPAVIARGESQFQIYCAVCHGERGDGNSIVARNMGAPLPPSLIVAPVSALPTSRIVLVVTDGLGRMPSFAAELSPLDRIAVAEYVKALQREAGATSDSMPEAATTNTATTNTAATNTGATRP